MVEEFESGPGKKDKDGDGLRLSGSLGYVYSKSTNQFALAEYGMPGTLQTATFTGNEHGINGEVKVHLGPVAARGTLYVGKYHATGDYLSEPNSYQFAPNTVTDNHYVGHYEIAVGVDKEKFVGDVGFLRRYSKDSGLVGNDLNIAENYLTARAQYNVSETFNIYARYQGLVNPGAVADQLITNPGGQLQQSAITLPVTEFSDVRDALANGTIDMSKVSYAQSELAAGAEIRTRKGDFAVFGEVDLKNVKEVPMANQDITGVTASTGFSLGARFIFGGRE